MAQPDGRITLAGMRLIETKNQKRKEALLIGEAELRQFAKREVMPGPLSPRQMESFVRDAALTYWHETGTCKMGRDKMAVVDSQLRVRGIDGLRVADGSIMPRVTTGNTMAPCMIIGERMAEILKQA